MSNLEYLAGDVVETKSDKIFLIEKISKDTNILTGSFYKKETPWNLIGEINNEYFLGDGGIDLSNTLKNLDVKKHIEKYGLSYFHEKRDS